MSQIFYKDEGLGTTEALAALDGLWRAWDPIGVLQDPNLPDDEYATYSRASWFFLKAQAGEDVVLRFLDHIETEWIGMTETPGRRARRKVFAQVLIEWFERFQACDPQARTEAAIARCIERLPERGDPRREFFSV